MKCFHFYYRIILYYWIEPNSECGRVYFLLGSKVPREFVTHDVVHYLRFGETQALWTELCTISFVGTMNSFHFITNVALNLQQSCVQMNRDFCYWIYEFSWGCNLLPNGRTWYILQRPCQRDGHSEYHVVTHGYLHSLCSKWVIQKSAINNCFRSKRGTFVSKWWDILLLLFKIQCFHVLTILDSLFIV